MALLYDELLNNARSVSSDGDRATTGR